LNITRTPGAQFNSSDGAVEVYGVKITADTGRMEYYAYGVGTNYTPNFSQLEKNNLTNYINNLVDHSLYRSISGNFNFNWTGDKSIISLGIGSLGWYTNTPSSNGLFSAGKPNEISVIVYRIGYITINHGVIALYKDGSQDSIKITSQLSNYENGFIYNQIIPEYSLSQINLFHPVDTPYS
jgi:hypothetical protein